MNHLEYIFIGTVTVAMFELLKLIQKYDKRDRKLFEKWIKSRRNWIFISVLSVSSGWFSWLYHYTQLISFWDVGMTAIAAKTILREIGGVVTAKPEARLGEELSWSEIFS